MRAFHRPSFWVLVACLVFTVAAICHFPQPILYDQSFISHALTPYDYFPLFEDGVFSGVFARLVGIFVLPRPEHLNALMRSMAAVIFGFGTYPLLLLVTRKESTRIAAVLLLFLSRYPFLWLSTELYAGALLALSLAAFATRRAGWSALALAMFALCKPDLVLPALAVALTYACLLREYRFWVLGVFLGALAILNAPGVWSHGLVHFQGTRSWIAFAQHYSDLFAPHQFDPALSTEPFGNAGRNVLGVFPNAQTFPEVVLRYPSRYLDYFAMSQMHFLKRLVSVFHLFLLAIAAIFWGARARETFSSPTLREVCLPAAVSLVGLLPITLITFVHARYLTRYVPTLLCVCAGVFEARMPGFSSRRRRLVLALLLAGFLVQIGLFTWGFYQQAQGTNFWVPD